MPINAEQLSHRRVDCDAEVSALCVLRLREVEVRVLLGVRFPFTAVRYRLFVESVRKEEKQERENGTYSNDEYQAVCDCLHSFFS